MSRWFRFASAVPVGDVAAPERIISTPLPRLSLRALALPRLHTLAVPALIFTVALVPRLILAHTLDLITDEGVYIPVGRLDYHLFITGNFGSGRWLTNFEAPALPKLLMGLGSALGGSVAPADGWLFGARLPGVLLSALFLAIAYPLARPIFGRLPALLGVLALALSPWVAYFAAIAYLDSYMVAFITLAILLTWHAVRRPGLFLVVGLLLGLGFDSKYTALFALAPICGYLAYYYVCVAQRRPPWQLAGIVPAFIWAVFVADPSIWADPISRFWNGIMFQYQHAEVGHDAFWNGQVSDHAPPGEALYILLAKMSLFVTIPALATLPWAVWRLWRARRAPAPLDDRAAFALCWLGGLLAPLALLNIVVGTHYMLPLAPAVALIGAWSLVRAGRWSAALVLRLDKEGRLPSLSPRVAAWPRTPMLTAAGRRHLTRATLALIALLLIVPPAYGMLTISQAEGYTSEWLSSENGSLQVAYPGYSDAVDWIGQHTHGPVTVTLVTLAGGLDYWMQVRPQMFPTRIQLRVGTPWMVPRSTYVVWPMHLVQRRFPTLANWH
ncbi:MAG TPA: glycosyltransferase family 39 protein, partial [Ktedonobacterales bacterium]|nr:glycosyltransferase family 39 protein [Ktedonobacterales bacterium]